MQLPRRRFLGGCVAGGLTAAAWGGWLASRGGRRDASRTNAAQPEPRTPNEPRTPHPVTELSVVRRSAWALGTEVSITALHQDGEAGRLAVDAAFAELALIERVMSIYREDSELSRLNRSGQLDSPHTTLIEVLMAANEWSRATDGAFDVTVQPLWTLHSRAQRDGVPITAGELAEARSRVDWRRVEFAPGRVTLRDGAQITLNGIAQGYAADRALAALRQHGVAQALVDTGELGAAGCNRADQPWRTGIQHPRVDDAFLAVVGLSDRFLATSGDYATVFAPDRSSHHVFDPRSGESPTELASVTVAAPTGMAADALSTAICVLGPRRGLALVERTSGADAWLVSKTGEQWRTRGFPTEAAL